MKTPMLALGTSPRRGAQRGAALFIALVSLIFMVLGGLALVRSVDTANVIAGNFSFKQAALHGSDLGVEAAFTLLNSTIVPTSLEANYPAGCNTTAPTNCRYFALQQADNLPTPTPDGVPDSVGDWSNVPSTSAGNGFSYQYVIDRLCQGSLPITNITQNCYAGRQIGGGSRRAGATVFTSAQEVYYRTTIRVTGPRNTTTLVQTIFAR